MSGDIKEKKGLNRENVISLQLYVLLITWGNLGEKIRRNFIFIHIIKATRMERCIVEVLKYVRC
jgi:hypothetical protein